MEAKREAKKEAKKEAKGGQKRSRYMPSFLK
jgi:hypothetical protein